MKLSQLCRREEGVGEKKQFFFWCLFNDNNTRYSTKEIEKHQRKMNQILLEERQLHGRSVEKLTSEKRNLEINGYKIKLEKDALEELVKVLTNEKQGLEKGLEGLQKKQADQEIQVFQSTYTLSLSSTQWPFVESVG